MGQVAGDEARAVRRIFDPGSAWCGPDVVVEALPGGAAHKNYLVSLDADRCVVKVWNGFWEQFNVLPPAATILDNTVCASRIGVGARVEAVCPESSGIALEFLSGRPPSLANDPDAIDLLVSALHNLHRSSERFANDLDPFAHARTLVTTATERGWSVPVGLPAVTEALAHIEEVIDLRPAEFVPCHNDLWDANIIADSSGYRLIDWDLAGNTDPAYELGFVAAYNGFSDRRTRQLASCYYGQDSPTLLARVKLFRIVAHWSNSALWIVAQGNASPNDGFDYAGELARSWTNLLRELMAPGLRDDLAAAARPAR